MNRIVLALGISVCIALPPAPASATPPPPPDMPSPARCPATPPVDEELNERKGPLVMPPRYAALIRSNRTNLAVWTMANANFCYSIANISEARNFTMSADFRFIGFDWYGYEEGGHIVIDRTGRGQTVDTGAKPVFSASGRQMAAIEWSESGFGSLNGFAIWRVNPVGFTRTVMIEQVPPLADWRIDSWGGDACVNLSGIPNSRIRDGSADLSKLPRDRYVARPAGSIWRITRATGRGCMAR